MSVQYHKIQDRTASGGKLKKRFRRGANMFNEAEVIQNSKQKQKDAKTVQSTGEDGEDAEFDNDIDFVVTLGKRKMTLRAASREEKVGWTKAMETASIVRSYSSKNLDDSPEAEKEAGKEMKKLTLEDLDIGEIIGSGSAGTVKLAVHIPTGMRVAVKIIPKRKFFMNKKLEETTHRELEMLDQISDFEHPNIVKTYGYVNDPQNVYIALELCEGGELLEELEHIHNYSEHDAASILTQMVTTLGYLHEKGIVHRDVKPENVLLKKKGASDIDGNIKMADFGLANILEGKDSLKTVCGSPAYMAPEVHNMLDYNEKVDMWSCGVMLFLLLSGQLPFLPPRLVEKAEAMNYEFSAKLWSNVSDAAKDLVVHLLVADPKTRYGVKEVLAHPWITGENRDSVDLKATQKAIALFSAKRKFKGLAHAVIASGRMKKAMASFSNVALDTTVGAIGAAAAVTTDLAYTVADAGDKAMETDIAKSAVSAAKAGMELEAVKKTRELTEQSIKAGREMTEQTIKASVEMTEKGLDAIADSEQAKQAKHKSGGFLDALKKTADDLGNAVHMDDFLSPKAAEDRKAKMAGVANWLEKGRLGLYEDAFEREGYDDIDALKEMEEEEIEELIVEVGMKKGHARNFKRRMKELQACISIDMNGSPPSSPLNSIDLVTSFDTVADAEGFIPYDRLPMPAGNDNDLTFQLGVGIGRVKLEAGAAEPAEAVAEVHAGREGMQRIKSPPRPERPSDRESVSPKAGASPKAGGGKGDKSPSEKKKKKKTQKKKKKPDDTAVGKNVPLGATKDEAKPTARSMVFDSETVTTTSPVAATAKEKDFEPGMITQNPISTI
jgi:tRNA A-37 threonylcarbamoyl transferase component Bud32